MIEILIVACYWSFGVLSWCLRKVFPKTSNSVFTTISEACARRGWSTLAKWLKPKMAAGCGRELWLFSFRRIHPAKKLKYKR